MRGRVVRILGVEVAVHRGWLLGFALVTALLVLAGFGGRDQAAPLAWVTAAVLAAAFLVSILLHELGHAVVARGLGLRPPRVSLFVGTGGSGALDPETERPTDEFLVAAGGPAVSLALALVAAALALVLFQSGDETAAIVDICLLVAAMNGVLGSVNFLPAFPFDGGRMLRAVLWRGWGDFLGATRAAVKAGRLIGLVGIAAGITLAVRGDAFVGLALGLIGWLLMRHAGVSYRWATVQRQVAGSKVSEAVDRDAPTVIPNLTLDVFVEQYLGSGSGTAFAVTSGGELLGTIDVDHVRRVPRDAWPTRRVGEEMVRLANVETVGRDDPLWPVIERFERERLRVMPVVEGSRLIGVLTRTSVAAAIQGRLRPEVA